MLRTLTRPVSRAPSRPPSPQHPLLNPVPGSADRSRFDSRRRCQSNVTDEMDTQLRFRSTWSPTSRSPSPPSPGAPMNPLLHLPAQGREFIGQARTPLSDAVTQGRLRVDRILRSDRGSEHDTFWRQSCAHSTTSECTAAQRLVAQAAMQARACRRMAGDGCSKDLGVGFFVHGAWAQSAADGAPFSPFRDNPREWLGAFAQSESDRGDVALSRTSLNPASRDPWTSRPRTSADHRHKSAVPSREQAVDETAILVTDELDRYERARANRSSGD